MVTRAAQQHMLVLLATCKAARHLAREWWSCQEAVPL